MFPHILASVTYASWPGTTHINVFLIVVLGAHFVLLIVVFLLAWACCLIYSALMKPDD